MPVKIMLPTDHNSTDERFSRTGQNCMWAELEEPREYMTFWGRFARNFLLLGSAAGTTAIIAKLAGWL
jgi:hypothetical protein